MQFLTSYAVKTTFKTYLSFTVPNKLSSRLVHTEVTIPVPWGFIAGKWWNKDDRRPILAIHGWQDNANTFDRLIPLMESKLPVLAIDLPGHGQSSHFPHGFPYHRMSAVVTLQRIVKFFNWERVSLMGHSLGGQTCFLYAAMYPEQVDSLATLDILAPIPMNEEKFIKNGGTLIDDFLKRDKQEPQNSPAYSYETLVRMVVQSPVAPVNVDAAKLLVARGSVETKEGHYRLTRDPRLKGFALAGWSRRELIKFCHAMKTNILCIKADSSPYFSTKEFFDECWANVSKVARTSELRYVPGGHHIHLEKAEEVASLVNDFFSRHYSQAS